jgi:hypothetical protein
MAGNFRRVGLITGWISRSWLHRARCAACPARDAQLEAVQARLAVLVEQIEELRRRLGKDSSTLSKPPSSDSPSKKPTAQSLRTRSGRKPGKQPGAPSSTLRQSPDPDDTVTCGPAACGSCGADLADAPVITVKKRQVFEAPRGW